jgi:RIO-like serine/threonine protein kinase
MTVTKLLTGRDEELSAREFNYWTAYFRRKAELEEEATNPKKKSGKATQEFKKTMGGNQTSM